MNSKHTATPWLIDKYGSVCTQFRADVSQGNIAWGGKDVRVLGFGLTGTDEARANTAFIVRAVNCHEELVAALQFIADNAKQMAESDSADRGLWAACNEQAGAILAKVQS